MTSKLFGLNGAVLLATAFLLAACAGSTDTPESAPAPEVTETDSGDGRPDAVTTPDVSESELGGNESRYLSADQQGLNGFAGNDRVFFEYDSSELSLDARRMLDRQIDWLKHHSGVRVVVEGHCDERGTREYNLALGERRAVAVKNYLTASGVSSARVRTISYGKERPAASGSGNEIWGLNRRGVLVVQ